MWEAEDWGGSRLKERYFEFKSVKDSVFFSFNRKPWAKSFKRLIVYAQELVISAPCEKIWVKLVNLETNAYPHITWKNPIFVFIYHFYNCYIHVVYHWQLWSQIGFLDVPVHICPMEKLSYQNMVTLFVYDFKFWKLYRNARCVKK